MMRINTGIVCVLAALAVGACSWGNGGSTPSPDASHTTPTCGDGVCASTEAATCPQDCGNGGGNANAVCGNGQCETTKGETATSCPSDCGSGSNAAVCGNGTCDAGETSTTCPSDCPGGGSGSGALNCSDPNTLIGCGLCVATMVCTAPYDAASCMACGL